MKGRFRMSTLFKVKDKVYGLFSQYASDDEGVLSVYNKAKGKYRVSTIFKKFLEKEFWESFFSGFYKEKTSLSDPLVKFEFYSKSSNEYKSFTVSRPQEQYMLISDSQEFHLNSYYLLYALLAFSMLDKDIEFRSIMADLKEDELSCDPQNCLRPLYRLSDHLYRKYKDVEILFDEDDFSHLDFISTDVESLLEEKEEQREKDISVQVISLNHGGKDPVPSISNIYPTSKMKERVQLIQNTVCLNGFSLKNILLYGPTSTGKSLFVNYLAYHLGLPKMNLSMNVETDSTMLLGREVLDHDTTYFKKSKFIDFVENGGVIELAEINTARSDELIILNSLLDNQGEITLPNGEVVKRHENCYIVGTYNVGYTGTKPFNLSLKRRFGLKFEMTDMSNNDIEKILSQYSNSSDLISKLVSYYREIQHGIKDMDLNADISITELINFIHVSEFLDLESALETTILPSLSEDTEIQNIFKTKALGVLC